MTVGAGGDPPRRSPAPPPRDPASAPPPPSIEPRKQRFVKAEVRADVRAALPAILRAHSAAAVIQLVTPLAAGRREKYFVRVSGAAAPLLLRIYGPGDDEAAALENGLVATHAIEARGTAAVGHCSGFDLAARNAPFRYRLHEMVWGTDAERILGSGALDPGDEASIGEALGAAAAAVHELASEGFGEPRARPGERAERLSDFVVAEVARRAERARRAGAIDAGREREIRRAAEAMAPALDARARKARLTHGGFGPAAAILRREGGRYVLSGIVGLDEARFFDPLYDLAALEEDLFATAPALRAPFLAAYSARLGAIPEIEPEQAALYSILRALA